MITALACDQAGRHGSALFASPLSAVVLAPVTRIADATGLSVARVRPATPAWQPAATDAPAQSIGGFRAVGDVDTFRGAGLAGGRGTAGVGAAAMKHNSIARSGPPRGRHR